MRRRLDPWILACVLIAALLRVPSLDSSLTEDDAALANAAWQMGDEITWPSRTVPPLLPMLAASPVAAGVTPTLALRALALVLAVLLVPLAVMLARRLGASRRTRRRVALLTALHPVLVGYVGGPVVGTASVLLPLGLCVVLGLASAHRRKRRVALFGAALLPLAHAGGVFYGACLLVGGLARHRSARLAGITVLIYVGTLIVTLPAWWGGTIEPGSALVLALVAVPAALLFSALPGLPFGLRSWLTSSRPAAQATRWWGIALVLHLGWWVTGSPLRRPGFSYAALDLAVAALPLAIVLGVRGLPRLGRRWARRVVVGTALASLAGALYLGVGELQGLMRDELRSPAGRLVARDDAVALALRLAPPGGFVVLEIDETQVGVHASMADVHPDRRWHFMRQGPTAGTPAALDPRALPVFPADDLDPDSAAFVAVRRAPGGGEQVPIVQWKPVVTYGRSARFHQEAPRPAGPYWIVRLSRSP